MNSLSTIIATFLLTIATSITAYAQVERHIEIEIDPLAYALGGASGHIAYTINNERLQIGIGILDMPSAMQQYEDLGEGFKAISLKWDKFFGRPDASRGFFAGPTADLLFLKYATEAQEINRTRLGVGLRTGYKFDLFKNSQFLKGLYLTPWVSVSHLINNSSLKPMPKPTNSTISNFSLPSTWVGLSKGGKYTTFLFQIPTQLCAWDPNSSRRGRKSVRPPERQQDFGQRHLG